MVFAFAYPETKGESDIVSARDSLLSSLEEDKKRALICGLSSLSGKSLEEIGEIFGDVQTVRENELEEHTDEKAGIAAVEVRRSRLGA